MKNTKILMLGLVCMVFASLSYANPIDFSKEINWMQNPAAKYCEDLGYDYVIVSTPQGELGLCRFNEADNATDLDFLTGKAKTQYGYCARKGFETKAIQNQSICHHPFTSECAVCVMPDGREKEVTALLSQDRRTHGTIAPTTTTKEPTTTLPIQPKREINYVIYILFILVSLIFIGAVAARKNAAKD